MHILITGGTGFIGSCLVKYCLAQKHSVTVVTRAVGRAPAEGVTYCTWEDTELLAALRRADAVVNLVGESLSSGLWINSRLEKFRASRIGAGQQLARLIVENNVELSCFIQGSAIGYYGSRGDEILSASSKKGEGFLADLCADWENSTASLEARGIRRVVLRTGLVLDHSGGLLKAIRLPFKLFLGGHLGDGSQWLSSIWRDDLCRLILSCLEDRKRHGVVNAVDGAPKRGEAFYKEMGKLLGRPSWLPVPAALLRMLPNNMADEFLLASQRVVGEDFTSS